MATEAKPDPKQLFQADMEELLRKFRGLEADRAARLAKQARRPRYFFLRQLPRFFFSLCMGVPALSRQNFLSFFHFHAFLNPTRVWLTAGF